MSTIAIQVNDLSKEYHIGGPQKTYDRLGDQITDMIVSPFRRAGKLLRGQATGAAELDKKFWALKDVCFEIKRGEVVGIIGRNGAGKSTLLKILSRITEPTRGYVDIYGRVGSLLEVGTGFHPELTGRENIYLNGAILGMKREEIERKFDEIVAFADIDKFIDTPVKHYSSGMYVRLAFAVAAHLEPEILLVDEVLAVGDVAFQKKCLSKMNEVTYTGRTILFVSHDMGAIRQLCPWSIVLDNGHLVAQGPSDEMIEWYLSEAFLGNESPDLKNISGRSGSGQLQFTSVYLQNQAGEHTTVPISGQPVDIVLEFDSHRDFSRVRFALTIFNQLGVAVTNCHVDAYGQQFEISEGPGQVVCYIPKLPFPVGRYKIAVVAYDSIEALDMIGTACIFDVETSTFFPTAFMPTKEYSTMLMEHAWRLNNAN